MWRFVARRPPPQVGRGCEYWCEYWCEYLRACLRCYLRLGALRGFTLAAFDCLYFFPLNFLTLTLRTTVFCAAAGTTVAAPKLKASANASVRILIYLILLRRAAEPQVHI
jgi:hypothetical protein